MMWEYCANCGSISLKPLSGKIKKCNKCGWEGVPDKGDMATINLKAMARNSKKIVSGKKLGNKGNPVRETTKDLKERLKKQTEDFEIF